MVRPSILFLCCILSLWSVSAARGESRHDVKRPIGALAQATDQQPSEPAPVLSPEEQALKAEMEKRWSDAERLYKELLAKDPNRVDLILRLSDVYWADGKAADAARLLGRAADLRSDDEKLQIRASEAFAAADQPTEALKYVDRALSMQPGDLDLQERRSRLAAWAGVYSKAEESLRALVAARPTDLSAKRDLGRVLSWEGHLPEAADLLGEYLSAHPDDATVLLDAARIEAARGDPSKATELLNRYRAAGGDEETYRHELALLPAPAAPQQAAAPIAPVHRHAAVPAPSRARLLAGQVPPAALRAEMQKRWLVAEKIYLDVIARQPDRFDLRLRLVDVLAAQGKRVDAAKALAHAADMRPQDADLQVRTSEAFAVANLPADALRYVDRALALRPTDLDIHRRRAELATWAGDNEQAEESLRILLAADPGEITLKRDLGRVLGWQGKSDEAAGYLSEYLAQAPVDTDALIEYARVQAARGDTASALDLLQRYRDAGGKELTYRQTMAMILAWGGRSYGALALSTPGLAADPNDFSFRFAQATALKNGYEYGAATAEVALLAQAQPNAKEVGDLQRVLTVSQRPYLQIDADLRRESDHILAPSTEISYHQPINDVWWLFVGGRGDFLRAPPGSGFNPIQGGDFIARGAGWVGAQARLDFGALASAQVGTTSNGLDGAKAIWKVSLDDQLSDALRLQLLNSRDYQTVSPRSLSFNITRIDTQAQATVTPDVSWTIAMLGQEAEFSDGNRLINGILGPRRQVLRTQYWNVDLGVSGQWEGYRFSTAQGGYYSPLFLQQYLTNLYVYYKANDDDGVGLVVSLGALKDNTMHSFTLANSYALEATLGLLRDWEWKFRAAYTNNGSSAAGPGFSSENFGMTLIRRF